MLDIKLIREKKEEVKINCRNRNVTADIDKLLALDDARKNLITQIELSQAAKNKLNEEFKNADAETKKNLLVQSKQLAEDIKQKNTELEATESQYNALMEQLPNFTHPDAPIGKSDAESKEIEVIGKIPNNPDLKDHLTLGKELDLIDFERAAKVTGARFCYLKNEAVMLEQALISYALNKLSKKGYTLISTPDLAKQSIVKASGFNPRDDSEQIYNLINTDLSLIATAEITVGGLHADEILSAKQLPLRYVGISHCFRKEAGTYGQESRGMYRMHQFTKVEMYIICEPGESEALHQELLDLEKEIYTELEIPFRVLDVCTGDLGGPAYRKYDLEAWMVMRQGWGEITSTSNCTDFQARRLKLRYKNPITGKNEFVHTLNGTAIAMSRTPIAILENHQQPDGSINIPKVLRPYFGADKISAKK